MSIKKKATSCRNDLQHGIYRIINPFVRLLIRLGFTPNMVTTIGMLGNIAAAGVIIAAGTEAARGINHWWMVTLSGALVIGFSLFDMLDGQVARLGNMVSRFGAMYDSILDRYCELFMLGGITLYLAASHSAIGAAITFLALVGSIMVSYVRARAEGVGLECKMGFMQRPERVVVTSLAVLATGITGECVGAECTFDPNIILIVAMAFIAVFANLTAFARINHCRKALKRGEGK